MQLNDCQKSIYCNQDFFGKGTDFKTFVVEFMIRMSKVCFYNFFFKFMLAFPHNYSMHVQLYVYTYMYVSHKFVP